MFVGGLAGVCVLGQGAQRHTREEERMQNKAGLKQNRDGCQRGVVMPQLIHSAHSAALAPSNQTGGGGVGTDSWTLWWPVRLHTEGCGVGAEPSPY